jgi:hypothetical protein
VRGGVARAIDILCDGETVAHVKRNRVAEFEVSPGQHELSASMDWATSPLLRVGADTDQVLHLYTRLRWTHTFLPLMRSLRRGVDPHQTDLNETMILRLDGG